MQIGSPTALAEQAVLDAITTASTSHAHGLYVPAGALWGGHDIKKMADRGTLKVASSLFLVSAQTRIIGIASDPGTKGDHEEAPLGF